MQFSEFEQRAVKLKNLDLPAVLVRIAVGFEDPEMYTQTILLITIDR